MNKLQMLIMRMRMPLSCESANDFIIDYLEGVLPPRVQKKFEKHIAMCPNCAVYLEQYKTTIELVKEDSGMDMPEDLIQHTLAFLKDHMVENNGS